MAGEPVALLRASVMSRYAPAGIWTCVVQSDDGQVLAYSIVVVVVLLFTTENSVIQIEPKAPGVALASVGTRMRPVAGGGFFCADAVAATTITRNTPSFFIFAPRCCKKSVTRFKGKWCDLVHRTGRVRGVLPDRPP